MTTIERDDLINESLPLIDHIARQVAVRLPPSVEVQDLVNAGVIGLLDAVDKFEPERGVKFKTYAELRVRGAILDSLRELDWAPRSLRKKSKDLQKIYHDLEQNLGRPATDQEVCEALGGDIDEFHALVDQLHGLTLGSFEDIGDSKGDGSGESFINYYPDDGENNPYSQFEQSELVAMLGDVIDTLPERERLVLSLRYYEEFTMKDVGGQRITGFSDSDQGRAPAPFQDETAFSRSRIRISTVDSMMTSTELWNRYIELLPALRVQEGRYGGCEYGNNGRDFLSRSQLPQPWF
jgi:RNA polymerase sigma factor for flagellar operon FliA